MKYILGIFLVIAAYYFLARSAPLAPVARAVTGQEVKSLAGPAPSTAQSDFIKRPLDRTHEVLDQVRKNKGEDSF